MKARALLSFILCCIFVLETSCASIFTGTSERVSFSSDPAGANVQVNGQNCITPCSIDLKKGENHQITFSKEGYLPKTDTSQKEFNPISLLNFLGLVGWIVDFGTGAVWYVRPSSYQATLQEKTPAPTATPAHSMRRKH